MQAGENWQDGIYLRFPLLSLFVASRDCGIISPNSTCNITLVCTLLSASTHKYPVNEIWSYLQTVSYPTSARALTFIQSFRDDMKLFKMTQLVQLDYQDRSRTVQ